jgi:DNA (cytosine-5)-methyltransferase 1
VNYYNENDPKAAAWLRELIKAGLIPAGEVDERSIVDVQPNDLISYTQCHFFAGIGGWSYALRLAGWPESRPVWTGSCPCQPFSVGSVGHGGAKGQSDERHLWPDFFRLISKRKPSTVFGEQVSDAVNWGWWDGAALDLEGDAYACAAAVLRADTFGAEHQRKRLYWMAHSRGERWQRHQPIKCVPVSAPATQPVNGDPLVRARRALAGDYSGLLPCDGLSVVMERSALKGYGNAIVPPCAAEFIQASVEAINSIPHPNR